MSVLLLTPPQEIADKLARGWSYSRLSRAYGVNGSTFRNWCLKHGLKSKHPAPMRRKKKTAA